MTFKAKLYQWILRKVFYKVAKTPDIVKDKILHNPQPIVIPKFITKKCLIDKMSIGEYDYYVLKPENSSSKKALMYLHGGGFVAQMTSFHWKFLQRVLRDASVTIYVPIYPLTTDTFSAHHKAIDFIIGVYKNMLKIHDSQDISIAGDSAGATFTLVLGQQLKLHKISKPRNLIAFSPLTDFTKTEDEVRAFCQEDAILPFNLVHASFMYCISKNDNPKDPLYSPLYGDSKDIGFITIITGTHEGFYKQIEMYHQQLNQEKIPHNYIVGDNMFHVYPLFKIKEAIEPYNLFTKLIA